jgi:hypothetical protein
VYLAWSIWWSLVLVAVVLVAPEEVVAVEPVVLEQAQDYL